ncbi:arabinosyltransferase domain-containing protein [Nocardia callitridis]|uniref:Arabinosyltransferase domain-containing protein n=1 Tax=Nocardia callitridis TaxID=648753 RepID=A0ABP9K1A7_9NOCA
MTVSNDAVRTATQPPTDPPDQAEDRSASTAGPWKLLAIIAAALAIVTAVSIPFLPVRQDQASLSWPQAPTLTSVTSPLVSYAPTDLSVDLPCTAFDTLADTGGIAVSTIPTRSADVERYGFVVKVVADTAEREGRVDVVSRNNLLWSTPLATVRGQSCALAITLTGDHTTVTATGLPTANADLPGDNRPQVVGLFTDLTGAAPQGLHADLTVDSRFSSTPTLLKFAAIIICLLATLASLVALHRLDSTDGRVIRRFLPARWWRLRPVDGVVAVTLVLWHFIGANTSDDGYQLGMARAAHSSGYTANFFRWFGVPESPFGTPYYDLISWMAKVSTASPWVRLPALAAALLIWWVISREVIPRLGSAARRNKVVVWTAALVFLAFWLPYNNGLRPEPMEALGVLLTWVSVERAIATRRLLPAAIALIIAAVTLTVGPSGLICCGALIAGARGLTQVIVRRARTVGFVALLLPLLAAGVAVLTAVFADQTLASVLEMYHVHGLIGPGEPWFSEYLRYQYLLQINSDGWLTRRFGVFVMVIGLAVCLLTMLRRGGKIPGTAAGPALRIVGITLGAMALMMFTPTKWTHHFGVYAGLAGSVAALTAIAVGPKVMWVLRNRALFAAAIFFALALSFVGTNGYWYVSSWGIPWWDKPPTIAGFGLSTFASGLVVLALAAAAWFHIRPGAEKQPHSVSNRVARVPVLAVVAAAMVLFEVLSFVKSTAAQYPSYSIGKSNVAATVAGGCGLADDVLVEADPNASMLRPLNGDVATALGGANPVGFVPNGVAMDLASDEIESTTGRANSVSSDPTAPGDAAKSAGSGTGTSLGTGVNGSDVPLPFGLDPASTPVLGSYGEQSPADLTSEWYHLPEAENGSRGEIISLAVAGRVRSVTVDGTVHPGQDLHVEYGKAGPDGQVESMGSADPIDIGPSPSWRNVRVPLDQLPADADVVRVVAADRDANPDQWLAVTPPRVPQTQTLNELVGSKTPVLLDWAVGLNFPCQNLMSARAGVAELPKYRVLPDRNGATITNLWQGHDGGGPLGWTQLLFTSHTLPAYLNNDWDRDWGSIEQFAPLDPNTEQAEVDIEQKQRSGFWTTGHINTRY